MSLVAAEPLSSEELDELDRFLEGLKSEKALSLEGLDGFFCALIAGPDVVLPSEYLPVIWGGALSEENAFASLEEANAMLQLLMRHWNSILRELQEETVYVPLMGEPDAEGVPGREWARGFMRGVAMRRAGWAELFADTNEGQLIAIPLVAGEVDPQWPRKPLDEKRREELIGWMAVGVARSYRHFTERRRRWAEASVPRRTAPKIGRNDRCPCGSGRKYKRCCGAPGRATERAPETVVGMAWYTPETWEHLLSVAADRDELEDSYEEWERGALSTVLELETQGTQLRKVPVDIDSLVRWCREREKRIDAEARAEYVTDLLRASQRAP